MEAVMEKVSSIIIEQLSVDRDAVVPETNLLDDLGADSLDVVELVMALEEEFGIEVPDDDVENIRTVKDVAEYIAARNRSRRVRARIAGTGALPSRSSPSAASSGPSARFSTQATIGSSPRSRVAHWSSWHTRFGPA